jgi:hypothetical protein
MDIRITWSREVNAVISVDDSGLTILLGTEDQPTPFGISIDPQCLVMIKPEEIHITH